MKINKKYYRTIRDNGKKRVSVFAIDQNSLPFRFSIIELKSTGDIYKAIREMTVRGAPLLGVAAAYGIYFACTEAAGKSYKGKDFSDYVYEKYKYILSARPTSVNPEWAMKKSLGEVAKGRDTREKISRALNTARRIADEDVRNCIRIGRAGSKIISDIYRNNRKRPVNILTHCNAGWLACIDYGTALSPVYISAERKIPVHVWVEETRPRNQGARLTAFELMQNGIPHTIITDNAGGLVIQKGMVDAVFTGADRITSKGDVCNKIGTYKTALAAHDNGVPFYVCAPLSSIDFTIKDGLEDIKIEERDADEVRYARDGRKKIELCSPGSPIKNYGFDITPSRLVTGIITENGLIKAEAGEIRKFRSGK
ncbi:MAG: S-methyl-5-thioribose-1-phosphate isomerase [Bacteroidetes bacterium]|nr:S-methyl-5-thioribose-1-phosphate isomerase [Bacteroidota bacterium]